MIGYYAHHRGSGHIQRAASIAEHLHEDVTILSSIAPDARFDNWVELPLDSSDDRVDVTANDTVHWAPLGSAGLRRRMADIASWIAAARPSVMVVDVSVEVVALARLQGVPVVTMAQPGVRDDSPHTLGYRMATAIIAPWPSSISPSKLVADVAVRLEHVGAISRLAVGTGATERDPRRVGILRGYGTRGPSNLERVVDEARRLLPGRDWVTPEAGADAVPKMLATCGLVFAHAGQNAVAEVASARVPAILVPEERPHEEQQWLARALERSAFPARIAEPGSPIRVPELGDWTAYCDGTGAANAAAIIERVSL